MKSLCNLGACGLLFMMSSTCGEVRNGDCERGV